MFKFMRLLAFLFMFRMAEDTGGGGGGNDTMPGGGGGDGEGGIPKDAWYAGFKDTTVRDWLHAYKGAYPSAEAVAQKALNLEKFVGAEKAGRGIIVPKSDAKPEEWQAFWKKVGGVPEKADGYQVKDAELAKDPLVGKFREHAHKIGMPPAFFDAALSFYQSEMKGAADAQMKDFETKAEADMLALKTDWPGIEYDKNIELGRRAAKAFIPHKDAAELENVLARMEGALGTKMTMQLWASIGAGLTEHGFVGEGGAGGAGGGGGGMTREGARLEIAALKQDREFASKLVNGDADAKAKWDRLHKIAGQQSS